MFRQIYNSGSRWEMETAYSRAVRAENMIFVSGTTAINDEEKIEGVGSTYLQSRYIFNKINTALVALGGKLEDVVRIRIFIINIDDYAEIRMAFNEFFKDIRPAATLVEVSNLMLPELLVEIEADAIVREDR